MAGLGDVRVEESLQVKIGEAKNLPTHSVSGGARNTFCAVRLDSEEIFRTSVVEKSLNPFYGEEFRGEIPKKFRYLSFIVSDSGTKTEKALGKVTLKKEELHKYHNKEHWFCLMPVDTHAEAQGYVHLEIRFDEYLNPEPEGFNSHRLAVRVQECSDLPIINGACNPYAVVTLSYGRPQHKEVKRTNVKKKTICPVFDETFFFDLENKGQNHDRNLYVVEDALNGELIVSLWHDESRVSREMLGNKFPGAFLGEVRIALPELDKSTVQNAWYCLNARENCRQSQQNLGSLRLKISYSADYVFLSHFYDELRELLLLSVDIEPIASSAAYILGEVVENRLEAAQPLMRLFLHHDRLILLVRALVRAEVSKTYDTNTLFRGNTLATKIIDEFMKFVGLPYLHDTLKMVIDEICADHKPCEIDPTKLKDGENINENMESLKRHVCAVVEAVVKSPLVCPPIMREMFHMLKEEASAFHPANTNVRYHVVSSFVFLRFFAPAILGPKLFELRCENPDPMTMRTFTLISKAIQGLVNLVSSKSTPFGLKEEYMVPLFETLAQSHYVSDIKTYLDIISSTTGARARNIEAPIVLKEGMMIKRAQGRKKWGFKNFKRRYFCLTNQYLMYAKSKEDKPLCTIPIEDILAVEPLREESFKMKYMFQVVQPSQRALYIQANNCVEEKEWLDILTKVSNTNKNRLKHYHPAAFMNGHWLCCKAEDVGAEGCSPVTGGLAVAELPRDVDPDRELEKIHSLFLAHMDKLDALQDTTELTIEACGCQSVYNGDTEPSPSVVIEDTKSCYETLTQIQKCVISLEQEHKQYLKMVQRQTVIGSIDAPIGDESKLITPNTRL